MKMSKLSRNLNVVEVFEDFALDTQVMDFDIEDLVDYVKENADVFYWLNIESIWGRCGFIWDVYENKGHFNNTSIKFNTLPRIPDPHRIKTLRDMFKKLSGGTYYINDNDWDNITELGEWGNSNQTFIFNMPSANFTRIAGGTSIYQPMSPLGDNIDWSSLKDVSSIFRLKITDGNRDFIPLDVDEIFNSLSAFSMGNLYLFLDSKESQEESIILNNIPDVLPFSQANHSFRIQEGTIDRFTLYRQHIDEEGTEAIRSLFLKSASEYYWPYPDVENPPIIRYVRSSISSLSSSAVSLFTPQTASEENFINCKVVPGYKRNFTWEEDVVIPHEYDVFNNPDHKVKYMNSTYVSASKDIEYSIKTGAAFYSNRVSFEHRLNLNVDMSLLILLDSDPSFTYVGNEKDLPVQGKPWSSSYALQWFEENDNTACGFTQNTYSNTLYKAVYHTISVLNSGIVFYDESGIVELTSRAGQLYKRTPTIENRPVNKQVSIIRTADGCVLHLNASYVNVLMLQDIYYKFGYVTIPHDTPYKIIFDSDSRGASQFTIIDCIQADYTIPNVFDFSNVTIKEGYEIQDMVGFSSFDYYLFRHNFLAGFAEVFITVDPTLDFIWQGDIKIVHNTTRKCSELMEKLQVGFIYDYPLSRVKQISTPTGTGNKIHLEGGFVFSLNDEDTVGNSEGVEYFLSKFKFRENPTPKENQLYLNSEQYALFTPEQVALLLDNGWEVIEVVF